MNIVQGIKIFTNSTVTNETYGLYAGTYPRTTSEFRFTECALSGLTVDWKDGFIAKKGISNITQKVDLLESGNTVQSSDITIRLNNTNQLNFFLDSNSISLHNCIVVLYEFIGTDDEADSVGIYVKNIRTIESVKWSETELILKVKMSLSQNRNNNLSVYIDDVNYPYLPESNKDKKIPIMFGYSDPINSRYFKIIRTNKKDVNISNIDVRTLAVGSGIPVIAPDFLSKFPVSENAAASDLATFKLGAYASSIYIALLADDKFTGLYIKIDKGLSDIVGDYRKISSSSVSFSTIPDYPLLDEIILACQLNNYMVNAVVGNATSNATDQCWVELYDIANEYNYTYYDVNGFYDSLTISPSNDPIVYTKEGDLLIQILETGIDLALMANTITFNPIFFSGAIDTFKCFKCLPFSSVEMYMGDNLDVMGLTGFNTVKTQSAGIEGDPIGGFYKNPTTDLSANAPTSTFTNAGYCLDKNSATYTNLLATPIVSSRNVTVYGVLELFLPDIPDTLKFKKCYLGINVDLLMSYTSGDAPVLEKIIVSKKAFYGDPLKIEKEINSGAISTTGSVKNLPDFYYVDAVSNKNKQFIVYDTSVDLTGYTLFDLEITTINEYRNIHKMLVAAGMRLTNTSSCTIDLRYNELALIFENEQDISNEVYV